MEITNKRNARRRISRNVSFQVFHIDKNEKRVMIKFRVCPPCTLPLLPTLAKPAISARKRRASALIPFFVLVVSFFFFLVFHSWTRYGKGRGREREKGVRELLLSFVRKKLYVCGRILLQGDSKVPSTEHLLKYYNGRLKCDVTDRKNTYS